MSHPLALFITFRTYGTWLPGAPQGYVDEHHNQFGEPYADGDEHLEWKVRAAMRQPAVTLSEVMRGACEESVRRSCSTRGWTLYDVVALEDHCHVVLAAGGDPEQVLGYLKARATHAFRVGGWSPRGAAVWSDGGSVRRLYATADAEVAVAYVADNRSALAARRSGR